MTDPTPEIRLLQECGLPSRHDAEDMLMAIDFSGWALVKKSALRRLCQSASVDYDDFDPTDGGRSESENP